MLEDNRYELRAIQRHFAGAAEFREYGPTRDSAGVVEIHLPGFVGRGPDFCQALRRALEGTIPGFHTEAPIHWKDQFVPFSTRHTIFSIGTKLVADRPNRTKWLASGEPQATSALD